MFLLRWLASLLTICLFLGTIPVAAENLTPTESIKGPVDDVIVILKDPAFKAPDMRAAQRDKIWKRLRPIFNFKEISRKTIGKQWATFSEEEQEKFAEVFAELLGNIYIDKIQGEYKNEKILFTRELVKGHLARVYSKLVREGIEIPIDYLMKNTTGQWLIFDILIEDGVSLVKNFRIEYRLALQKMTPAQLIQQLEEKVSGQ